MNRNHDNFESILDLYTMKTKKKPAGRIYVSGIIAIVVVMMGISGCSNVRNEAKKMVKGTGLSGGLIVHLECEDEQFLTGLHAGDQFIVHGLSSDGDMVNAAREYIKSRNKYGEVSIIKWEESFLPYTDNLVNILVADNLGDIPMDEVMRVLTPRGVAFIKNENEWKKVVKPVPEAMDEWGHHLHGPDGNPVAQDSIVGSPQHYQWISGPTWLQSHETHSSINGVVTSGGRLFYFENESPASMGGNNDVPDQWVLKARDAFNGIYLWKRPLEDWGWREWKTSWFLPRDAASMPINIQRRIVADGKELYVTMGYHSPVYQLDAATGKTLQTYTGTDSTYEILVHEGRLILSVKRGDKIKAMLVDTEDGRIIWDTGPRFSGSKAEWLRWDSPWTGPLEPVPLNSVLNAATNGNELCLLDNNEIVCLSLETGEEKWRTAFQDDWLYDMDGDQGFQVQGKGDLWVGVLIMHDDVVLHQSPRDMAAISAETGEVLWTRSNKVPIAFFNWKEVFVYGDQAWTWSYDEAGLYAEGYDIYTGTLQERVPLGEMYTADHHARCYQNKGTARFLITARRGTEFVDMESTDHTVNNWIRGACHYGLLPANGLLYITPHPCVCYPKEKITGFNALATYGSIKPGSRQVEMSQRLEKGPAYLDASGPAAALKDWPTYRHDIQRSGSVDWDGPAGMNLNWTVELDEELSPPVIAGNRVFVSVIDQYTVVGLDAGDGEKIWEYTTGSRVNSPPTYHEGKLLFGSNDGWLYCLRASDGELAWRFRAAPGYRMMINYSRLESAWPVYGSVLVQNGTAYITAGRSSHLDGGIYVYGLDPETGEILYRNHLEGPDREFEEIDHNIFPPEGALADIMQGDGDHVYLRHLEFDQALTKLSEDGAILRTMSGFLDDAYFRRSHWYFGNWKNRGKIIVNKDSIFYALVMFESLKELTPYNYFNPGEKGYLLYSHTLHHDDSLGQPYFDFWAEAHWSLINQTKLLAYRWANYVPVRGKAMALAGDQLYLAGPPDIVDPEDPHGAFEGRKGGVLRVISSETGRTMEAYKLDSPPVFNGIATAQDMVFLTLKNGDLVCLGRPAEN